MRKVVSPDTPGKEQIPSRPLKPPPPRRLSSKDSFIAKMSRALKRLECKYGASPIFSDNKIKIPHIVKEFKPLWENLPFFSFDILQKKLPQTKSTKKVCQKTGSPDRKFVVPPRPFFELTPSYKSFRPNNIVGLYSSGGQFLARLIKKISAPKSKMKICSRIPT